MKKWVPVAMRLVVEKAVARLTRIGAPAREAARFAYDHPEAFMRHEGCITSEGFRGDEELSPEQLAAAVGTRRIAKLRDLPARWKKLYRQGPVTYNAVAGIVSETYKNHDWPYINNKKEVLVWDALCLVREFELHKEFSVQPFSWRLIRGGEVNGRLGAKGRESISLFEKFGFRNPDGSNIYLASHQLRHWLSTMSARGGMDDFTLARWAGRACVEDNRSYDHRTPHERSEELRSIIRKGQPTTLEKFKARFPVTYHELGVDRPGTAKVTLYGMCVHDYAMAPCMKQQECMTCKEHVCIKGDHVTLDRISLMAEQVAEQLDKARQASSDGAFGADRWVDHYIWKLSHLRTMRTLLEAESVPDGTVLRIPDQYDPPPVRRGLMEKGLVDAPESQEASVMTVVPLIEERDADDAEEDCH